MAARQPLALVGGAYEAYSTGDDMRANSIGAGVAATGTTGEIKASVRFLSGDGLLTAAAFAFTTEPNTGLRLAAAGDLRAVVAGADALLFAGSGLITAPGQLRVKSGTDYSFEIQNAGGGSLLAWRNTASPHLDITGGSYGLFYNGQIIGARFGVTADVATVVCGVFRGAASQSADLTQWQNSAGAVLSKITSAGVFSPQADNALALGAAATAWSAVYARLLAGTSPASGAGSGIRVRGGDGAGVDQACGDVVLELGAPTGSGVAGSFLIRNAADTATRFTVDDAGLVTVANRITGVSAPTAASDAVRADEASIPIGAAPGTLTSVGGATKYSGPYTTQPGTTETAVSFLVPHAMVLRNLRVRAQAAPTGASVLFTAFVNELANTALEVDYLTTSSGTVSDTVGSITLAAGDRLSIKIVMNTGYNDNSMTDVRWSLDATRL